MDGVKKSAKLGQSITNGADEAGRALGNSAFRIPQSSIGPALAALFFLAHCAIFFSIHEQKEIPNYAWRHLPLDDAWIHLSYARNLLAHGYFTYNPGEIETGATSPLWVVLLAALMAVLRSPVLAAKAAGMACGAACVGLGFAELRQAGGRVAAWAGALALALDPIWIMSCGAGMEIPLAGLLMIGMIRAVRLGRPWAAGALMGLAVLARPDAATASAAAGVLLFAGLWMRDGARPALRGILKAGLLGAALCLPWFLYCRLGTGHWLPCTFYVKGQGHAHFGWEKFGVFVSVLEHGVFPSPLVHDPVALALIALGVGAAALAWRRPATAAWLALPVAHLAGWAMLNPVMRINAHPGQYLTYVFTRYYVPDYPLVFGLLGLGAAAAGRGVRRAGARLVTGLGARGDRALRRALVIVPVAALVAGNFFGWWCYLGSLWKLGDSYSEIWKNTAWMNAAACRNIFEIHECMAKWVDANVPADAVVATQDAGAIRFFARQRIIDLWGLNSHEYLFAKDKAAYLRAQGARVSVTFVPGRLEPLFDFKPVRDLASFTTMFPNKISEGDTMVVREIR